MQEVEGRAGHWKWFWLHFLCAFCATGFTAFTAARGSTFEMAVWAACVAINAVLADRNLQRATIRAVPEERDSR